jgi:hypothetical protein
MIVKNKNSVADRAFWAHCEAVAAEVGLWPKWMRGEGEAAVPPPSPPSRRRRRRHAAVARNGDKK